MPFNTIDILFLLTVALLVFNGVKNGAVVSLVSLIAIPVSFVVAYLFGPQLTTILAANQLPSTPFISYIVLFLGTGIVLHIIATAVRGTIRNSPIGCLDGLLGAAIGFVEAWLVWLILLLILGNFLNGLQEQFAQGASVIPGLNVQLDQFKGWHDFYNQAITDSLFAKVNGFFVQKLPNIPRLPK